MPQRVLITAGPTDEAIDPPSMGWKKTLAPGPCPSKGECRISLAYSATKRVSKTASWPVSSIISTAYRVMAAPVAIGKEQVDRMKIGLRSVKVVHGMLPSDAAAAAGDPLRRWAYADGAFGPRLEVHLWRGDPFGHL